MKPITEQYKKLEFDGVDFMDPLLPTQSQINELVVDGGLELLSDEHIKRADGFWDWFLNL